MSQNIPPDTIRAHLIPGANVDPADHIRPCKAARTWMDESPKKYVYRCIPLVAANTMGWELLNPIDAEVQWTGGPMNTDLQVQQSQRDKFGPVSHFGVGMVTWYVPFIFRTSSDLGLIVTGPANHEHNMAVPLDAFVRTDWLPFPFTMNWRITEKNQKVFFKKGEPIARILPYPIAMLNETKLDIVELSSDPEFLAEVNQFGQARSQNVQKAQADIVAWLEGGEKPSGEGVWNSQYVRAKGQGEDGFENHQTIFRPSPPRFMTGSEEE